jgi:hypothetical protein
MIQLASDVGNAAGLVFFLFDLLYLDGDDVSARQLIERTTRLAGLLAKIGSPLQYSDHRLGHGRAFFEKACALLVEDIVSKRRCPLRARQPVAQGQMSTPRGIRRGRLDRVALTIGHER